MVPSDEKGDQAPAREQSMESTREKMWKLEVTVAKLGSQLEQISTALDKRIDNVNRLVFWGMGIFGLVVGGIILQLFLKILSP